MRFLLFCVAFLVCVCVCFLCCCVCQFCCCVCFVPSPPPCFFSFVCYCFRGVQSFRESACAASRLVSHVSSGRIRITVVFILKGAKCFGLNLAAHTTHASGFFFTKKTSPRPQSKRRGILFGIVELTREARIILYHDTINIITY